MFEQKTLFPDQETKKESQYGSEGTVPSIQKQEAAYLAHFRAKKVLDQLLDMEIEMLVLLSKFQVFKKRAEEELFGEINAKEVSNGY